MGEAATAAATEAVATGVAMGEVERVVGMAAAAMGEETEAAAMVVEMAEVAMVEAARVGWGRRRRGRRGRWRW